MLALHRDAIAPPGDEAPLLDRGVWPCPWDNASGHRVYVAIAASHRWVGLGEDPVELLLLLDQLDPVDAAPVIAIR